MATELKPCPFCGHVGLDFDEGSTFRWGIASCAACGATCGEVRRTYPDDGKWHAEAIEAWNRRTRPAQVPRLSDVEWMNIVNKNQAWFGYSPEDVAHEVFKLTEAALIAKWSKT